MSQQLEAQSFCFKITLKNHSEIKDSQRFRSSNCICIIMQSLSISMYGTFFLFKLNIFPELMGGLR